MMEGWPTVAWILLLTAISDRLKTIQARDFTMKDIILLHPSTTPHPGSFKCFTCEDAADNYDCNRWAPDVYCPKETNYCYTLHMMDNLGDSVSVTKRCATLENCRFAGCVTVTDNGYQVCTSCCEGNICNMLVPRDNSSAVFSKSPLVNSGTRLHPAVLLYFIIISISTCRVTSV
ncbi:ly6/PLAUR domain-containing protein 6 [Cololabis saira]|uniref:ly6/PLAUR domain-containing protein 6 n=1 Tax=Cololabis saira TaxID=129043 RepID=UPI002AD48581|nr:ly6/PLAUR domain-containing protein 6 [Cololabis saira]XP_061571706.1 ly6/PLAUR domain-containing protein 6 [Cololabis saira]